jgi:hypothetical protein
MSPTSSWLYISKRKELTLGEVALVHECWDDMRTLQIASVRIPVKIPSFYSSFVIGNNSLVVILSKHIRRDGTGEVASELVLVRSILDIDHPLSMCIASVALMGWPKVNLVLVKWVCDLVREDTGRQARDYLVHVADM